ncbi:hypothetical protein CFP56_009037 [Quercus suber]|uniref:Uncharacterized protein n=1 Tax=Quercus suber TaxID=58331 RepID=A0AAW0L3M5_QUESU
MFCMSFLEGEFALDNLWQPCKFHLFWHHWFAHLTGNMNSTELDMNKKFTITLRKKQPLQLIPKGRK